MYLKHLFRWLESTPWTETPLYPGRAQKPEEQLKYHAAMATKNGISKAIYALLDCFGGLSKIHKAVVVVGIAVLVILFFVGTFANTKLQKPSVAANLANLPPQSEIDDWKADENKIPLANVDRGYCDVESTTIDKIVYGSQRESRGGKGIPVGTVIYPLRIHISQVPSAVQRAPTGLQGFKAYPGAESNPPIQRFAPGIEHEIVDVYFYQDVFGKWLYHSAGHQIVDFTQNGPTPQLLRNDYQAGKKKNATSRSKWLYFF